jgi:hypothetical protein
MPSSRIVCSTQPPWAAATEQKATICWTVSRFKSSTPGLFRTPIRTCFLHFLGSPVIKACRQVDVVALCTVVIHDWCDENAGRQVFAQKSAGGSADFMQGEISAVVRCSFVGHQDQPTCLGSRSTPLQSACLLPQQSQASQARHLARTAWARSSWRSAAWRCREAGPRRGCSGDRQSFWAGGRAACTLGPRHSQASGRTGCTPRSAGRRAPRVCHTCEGADGGRALMMMQGAIDGRRAVRRQHGGEFEGESPCGALNAWA